MGLRVLHYRQNDCLFEGDICASLYTRKKTIMVRNVELLALLFKSLITHFQSEMAYICMEEKYIFVDDILAELASYSSYSTLLDQNCRRILDIPKSKLMLIYLSGKAYNKTLEIESQIPGKIKNFYELL